MTNTDVSKDAIVRFTVAQCVTLSLNKVSLFGAGLAVAITADMVEGEEQVMLLMELSWQLNLILRSKTNKH